MKKRETPLVSIIIPVYNRSATIERCMDSILAQSYRNIEVIAVNDGSTDDSLARLYRYAAVDSRVTVFNKPNSGVSDSRNYALESAHGAYIQFVDSDDWITEDATERFVRTALATDCDLVVSDYYRLRGEQLRKSGTIKKAGIYDRIAFAKLLMEDPGDFYYGVVWNKFFKRKILEKKKIYFDDSLQWSEDFLFNLDYLRHADKIAVIKEALYFYVKTKGSLVNTLTTPSNVIRTKLYLHDFYKDFFQELGLYEDNKLRVTSFLVRGAGDKKHRLDRETYLDLKEKYLDDQEKSDGIRGGL